MIRSAVAGPMPGSVARPLASCSSIIVATSWTGRTIARSAFFTPTPSTSQNISKNSRSIGLKKPTSRGMSRPCIALPSRYSTVCRLTSWPILSCKLPPGEFGDQHFVFERADGERERVGRDGDRRAGDFGDHGEGRESRVESREPEVGDCGKSYRAQPPVPSPYSSAR